MEKKFIPKPGQVDFTNIRYAPVVSSLCKYKDKFLFVQRSRDMLLYPECWNGISGFLDDNRSIEEKVAEELREEIGLSKKNIVSIQRGRLIEQEDPRHKKTWIIHPILVTVNTDKIKLNWEAQNYVWMKMSEAKKLNLMPGFLETMGVINKIK